MPPTSGVDARPPCSPSAARGGGPKPALARGRGHDVAPRLQRRRHQSAGANAKRHASRAQSTKPLPFVRGRLIRTTSTAVCWRRAARHRRALARPRDAGAVESMLANTILSRQVSWPLHGVAPRGRETLVVVRKWSSFTRAAVGVRRRKRTGGAVRGVPSTERPRLREEAAFGRVSGGRDVDGRGAEVPDVRCFGSISHLWTPIRARPGMRDGRDVLRPEPARDVRPTACVSASRRRMRKSAPTLTARVCTRWKTTRAGATRRRRSEVRRGAQRHELQ